MNHIWLPSVNTAKNKKPNNNFASDEIDFFFGLSSALSLHEIKSKKNKVLSSWMGFRPHCCGTGKPEGRLFSNVIWQVQCLHRDSFFLLFLNRQDKTVVVSFQADARHSGEHELNLLACETSKSAFLGEAQQRSDQYFDMCYFWWLKSKKRWWVTKRLKHADKKSEVV